MRIFNEMFACPGYQALSSRFTTLLSVNTTHEKLKFDVTDNSDPPLTVLCTTKNCETMVYLILKRTTVCF